MRRRFLFLGTALAAAMLPFALHGAPLALPKSLSVTLPDGVDPFPGVDADAINQNCLGCHSSDMVLNQPALTKEAWQAEVAKMMGTYKAPVSPQDVDAIVAYLTRTKGLK
jgi:mono/diheme cytochrome c family protein